MRTSYFLRYFVEDQPVMRTCGSHTYGGSVREATLVLLDSSRKTRFVEIFEVDPRVEPNARPIATRYG